ncbi:unnamed protein product [Boreogadus saida]
MALTRRSSSAAMWKTSMLSDDDVISLLHYLRKKDVLNDQEMKTVEGKMTREDRARCLIDTVMEKGERESCLMVGYLSWRYPDLCWTLGLTPTSARIKLGRIGSKLIDRLSDDDVISLLHYLRKMDVLNDEEKKTVEEKTTREDRARCLNDTVMKKGVGASSLMVDYLTERYPVLCWTLGLTPARIKLRWIRSKLIDRLSDDDVINLLRYLRKMDGLNDEEKKTVEGKTTREDRARCLIDTVMEKREGGSRLMVDYLTERHPDLCWTRGLTPTSAWIKLRRIHSELIDRLSDDDVIDLLHYLRKMDVLNDEEMKTVEGKTTREDRARCLIDTVMEKREGGSSLMVDYLTERHPDLCWTLGLTPTSAWIKLRRIHSELIDRLSDDDVIDLLHYLRKMDVLNDEEKKTVEGKTTREDRARCLIDTVMEKREGGSSLMVDYLTERHPDLCWTLGLTPTSARIKLGRIRSELIDSLSDHDVVDLLYYLRMKDVLNDEEKKTVEGKMTGEDRARCLIDTVMRKGERESRLMVDYLTEMHPDLCWTRGLTPTSARIKLGRIRSKLIHRLSDDDVINLLRYLRMMDVLNDQEKKTVEEKTTREDGARCLIDTVMRKGERESCLMVGYLSWRYPDLCSALGLTPTSARIRPLELPLQGTSLSKDTASMPVVDRCGEEDGSDSVLRLMKMMKVSSVTLPLSFETRLQLKGKGTYECSATGLVFEVSEQALVRYSVLSWFQFSEFLQDSWRPAGSIYDVDVVDKDPSVLKFIHFPHSLCLAEPVRQLSFSVLHVKERHADIESTVGFTASHVKWRVSSLSLLGLILRSIRSIYLWMVEHHAMVLIYKELNKKAFIFQVYLGSNSISEFKAIDDQVNKSNKECIRIDKPATCTSRLVAGKYYHLRSQPERKVEPSIVSHGLCEKKKKKLFRNFVVCYNQRSCWRRDI